VRKQKKKEGKKKKMKTRVGSREILSGRLKGSRSIDDESCGAGLRQKNYGTWGVRRASRENARAASGAGGCA
jgi:hypothetical protein